MALVLIAMVSLLVCIAALVAVAVAEPLVFGLTIAGLALLLKAVRWVWPSPSRYDVNAGREGPPDT